MFQLFNVLTYRTRAFKNIMENKWLVGAIISSILLQMLVVYTPLYNSELANAFNIGTPEAMLNLMDWLKIILVSSTVFILIELKKRI